MHKIIQNISANNTLFFDFTAKNQVRSGQKSHSNANIYSENIKNISIV